MFLVHREHACVHTCRLVLPPGRDFYPYFGSFKKENSMNNRFLKMCFYFYKLITNIVRHTFQMFPKMLGKPGHYSSDFFRCSLLLLTVLWNIYFFIVYNKVRKSYVLYEIVSRKYDIITRIRTCFWCFLHARRIIIRFCCTLPLGACYIVPQWKQLDEQLGEKSHNISIESKSWVQAKFLRVSKAYHVLNRIFIIKNNILGVKST